MFIFCVLVILNYLICLCILFTVTVENPEEHHRILLHVEDYGPLRPAEESKGGGGRVQAQTSLHS